jgi:phage FluMu protein Com
MNKRACLRCGSTDLQPGVIYDCWQYGKTQLAFEWNVGRHLGPDSVPLNAIICKSCGHTELIASMDAFIPSTRRECPYCKAIYSYREKDESAPNVVRCYNCNNEFEIYPPKKCPSCGAVYLYSKEMTKEGTVVCQNCGKLFLIQKSTESGDLIDEIAEDLLEK